MTQPFAELVKGLNDKHALAFLRALDDLSVKRGFMPNVGPAMLRNGGFDATTCPTARWARIRLFGDVGHLMDFDTGEVATGHALGAELRVRPTDRIELLTTVTRESRRTGEAATLLYYLSTASSWRLEWLHHASSIMFSYRPSWRQSLFVGASSVRRAGHTEGRVFLKWSRAFDAS